MSAPSVTPPAGPDILSACDLLLAGGSVVDGTGRPRYRADVAVVGDRIAGVGAFPEIAARRRIDARDLVVAPGFIDAHTHDDRLVLSHPEMTPKVSQGVTTVVTGNCGISLAPLVGGEPPPPLNLLGDGGWFRHRTVAGYAAAVADTPPAVNVAMLVGHSTLRVAAMDRLDRPATGAERERMGEALEEAMEAGCIGLSTGLAYPTASAAPTAEVIELARRLAPFGGIYATHMRDERDRIMESIEETLTIGREAGAPVVISHHKCAGRRNWGRTRETLPRIRTAQREQTVNFDAYAYTASSTVLLPDFVASSERVLVTWSEPHPEQAGRDLADVVAEWGCGTAQAIERLLPAGAIYHQMDEEDLERVLAFPGAMIGSDGLPHDRFPHPRLWGTFPRVLGHYCRDRGLFSLEEAVRRMTGNVAATFGLADRGAVRAGGFADLVLFDPDRIADRADFEAPTRPAAGIHLVVVNGEPVWQGGAVTDRRPGRIVARTVAM